MSKKNKEKEQAQQREQQAFNFYAEDRTASRNKSNELAASQGDRLKDTIALRDKSRQFLNDADSGKDIAGLLQGELAFRGAAADRKKTENRMYQNTGARKLAGAPDANFQYQMDSLMNAESDEQYGQTALELLENNKSQAKQDMLTAENVLNADEYNIANVLNGNVAQAGQFWQGTANQKQQIDNKPSWFSKYIMPFAQGAAGGITSWLTGGGK